MALPATHIRFAAILADRLKVTDRCAYLSGTLYPDSRWVTGLNRPQTHARRFLDPDFPSDDFTLGWHVHCQCDRIQKAIHTEVIGDIRDPDERWIRMSAAKVIQDVRDAARGQIKAHLPLLTCVQTPAGESAEAVRDYYEMVRRAYGGAGAPGWSDYARLWQDVGLDARRIGKIRTAVERIQADATRVDRLHDAFDAMVSRWRPIDTNLSSGGSPGR
jgi:hypothetical protein